MREMKLAKGVRRSRYGNYSYQVFCKYCDTPIVYKWIITKNWGRRHRAERQYCPTCDKLRHNCNQTVEKREKLGLGRVTGETKEERKARLIAIVRENQKKRKEARQNAV